MKTIKDALDKGIYGLHYGNRLLLPFHVEVLKVAVEKDLIMDFSSNKKGAEYNIKDDFTEIYFHDFKFLEDIISKYEVIKMVVVEKGSDIFKLDEHTKISVDILDHHKAEIKKLDDDSIFID